MQARKLPATSQSEAPPQSGSHPFIPTGRRWLGFASIVLGLFTILSATTSVSTALPVIQRDLNASLTQIEWLIDAYLIVLTVFMTTFGRLGDLFGRKRMFITGSIIFAVGNVFCALARDAGFLIAFRAFAGLGPAMMMPATLSLITDLFPPEKRGIPMGIWGSVVGAAVGVGPVMGGLLVSNASWQWVFWINCVLAVIAGVAVTVLLPNTHVVRHRPSLDLPGILLNAGFVLCLSYGLVEGHDRGWTSPLIVGLLVASAILLGLFILREMKTHSPMLDLSLFRRPAFSAGVFVTLTVSFGILGTFVFMPLFLQGPEHASAIRSGLTLLPVAIAMAVVGPIGGFMATRVSPRWPISAAMVLFSGAMFVLSRTVTPTVTWQELAVPFVFLGIGLGISSANVNTAVMRAVPRHIAGAAAGVVTTTRQLGSVLGVAVLGAVLQTRIGDYMASATQQTHSAAVAHDLAFTDALRDTLLVAALVMVLGAGAALLVRHSPEE